MNDTNCIFNDIDNSTIGFYRDMVKLIKEQASNALQANEHEQALDMIEILHELDNYTNYDGLLVLSDNNGMGYTISKYRDDWEVAEWVSNNIAPEDDDAMPKIYGDHERQKDFMEQVKKFMKGE